MHHKPPWLFTRGTVLVLVLAACCCHDSVRPDHIRLVHTAAAFLLAGSALGAVASSASTAHIFLQLCIDR